MYCCPLLFFSNSWSDPSSLRVTAVPVGELLNSADFTPDLPLFARSPKSRERAFSTLRVDLGRYSRSPPEGVLT